MSNQIIDAEVARYLRKIALRPTLAAICQQIFDAGFDCRNHLAAMGTLSQRDYDYWQEFIPSATPGDWLIWAAEDVSRNLTIEMMGYYHDAITALRKVQQPGNGHI